MEAKKFLIEWFAKNSSFSEDQIQNKLDQNYFEQKWLDSFEFIKFITDIESTFSVSFQNEEFQNPKFTNINGLATIITEKCKCLKK